MPSAAFLRIEAAGKARQRADQAKAAAQQLATQQVADDRAQQRWDEIKSAVTTARERYRRELADHMATRFKRRPSEVIRKIVARICIERSVSPNEIFGQRHSRHIVQARQEIWWLCRRDTTLSYPQIARHFHKDHSTVLHGCRRHEARMAAAMAAA